MGITIIMFGVLLNIFIIRCQVFFRVLYVYTHVQRSIVLSCPAYTVLDYEFDPCTFVDEIARSSIIRLENVEITCYLHPIVHFTIRAMQISVQIPLAITFFGVLGSTFC